VTWATYVQILVFLGLSVLELGPMYATDTSDVRQTDVRRASSLNAPYPRGGGITRRLTVVLGLSRYFIALVCISL